MPGTYLRKGHGVTNEEAEFQKEISNLSLLEQSSRPHQLQRGLPGRARGICVFRKQIDERCEQVWWSCLYLHRLGQEKLGRQCVLNNSYRLPQGCIKGKWPI